MKPKILITNDDGIGSDGIFALYEALKESYELTIVAPAYEQSGVGVGISLHTPLKVAEIDRFPGARAWSVTGTPADCVKMGLSIMLKTKPDLVVSGINCGGNHGRSLLYSGTCGGAIEAAFQGFHGLAFSCYDIDEPDYKAFGPYIPRIVDFVLKNALPSGTILNVNFPGRAFVQANSQFKIKLTRQGRQFWISSPVPESESVFRLGSELATYEESDESDAYWLERGVITASPVHVDELTDWRYLHAQKEQFENIFSL